MVYARVRSGVFSWFLAWLLLIGGSIFCSVGFANDDLPQAIEAWLEDNDERAIPALAELAASGNADARLLLAQIDGRPGALSNYLGGLSRKERNILLKAPGGLSGKSWLQAIEAENETARALTQASDAKFSADGIKKLLDLGEAGPAVRPLLELMNFGDVSGVMRLSGHENFPEDARVVAWLSALLASGADVLGRQTDLLAELDEKLADYDIGALSVLFGSRALFDPEEAAALADQFDVADILNSYAYKRGSLKDPRSSPGSERVDRLLSEEEAMKPLVGICAEECPASTKSCLRTLYHGVAGYMGYLALQSPLESLIPRDVYFASKRHTSEIKRYAFKLFNARWGAKARELSGTPIGSEADECIVSSVLEFVGADN